MDLNISNRRTLHSKVAITLAIWHFGASGITGKKLEEKSGLSRQTINHEREGLEKEGLIDYKHRGKRTTYYPGKLFLDNQYLRSMIYGRKLLDTLTNPPLNIESPVLEWQLLYHEKTQRTIATLCIRIGLILLYSFLQVMNPKSEALISPMEYKSNTTSSRAIREHLAMEWLKDSVDFEKILIGLRQEFYLLGCKFKIDSNKKSHTRHSFFELEDESYIKITQAYASVFPNAFKQLEKIDRDLSSDADYWKMWRRRHKCEHRYEMSIENNKRIFTCINCGKRITGPDEAEMLKIKTVIPITKLNELRPPTDHNCIRLGHQWYDLTRRQLNKLRFTCVLCNATINQNFETDEEMQLIEEEVSVNIGIHYVRLAKDVEYFFHYNRNKAVTIPDFIKFYEFRGTKIVVKKSFADILSKIIEILLIYSYIKLKSDHIDPLKKKYMRELVFDL